MGVALCSLPLFSAGIFVLFDLAQVFFMLLQPEFMCASALYSACRHSLSVHVCISPVFFMLSQSLSSCIHPALLCLWRHSPLDLTIFLLFCSKICEPWGERFDKDILFSAECSKSFHSLHIVQQCHLLQEEAWGLCGMPICVHSTVSLGIILLCCSFSRIIVLCFPLWPETSTVSNYFYQCQV